MIDIHSSNITFKLNWIKHFIKHKDKIWYIIPNLIFKRVGGIEFLLKCDYDINKLPLQLSNFHRQALLCWLLIYKHNFSPHRHIIWNNKYIKYKNKSIFYDNWVQNDILLLSQLINDKGYLLSYSEFLKKFNIPILPKEYSVVFDAIPAGFLRLLQGNTDSDKQLTFQKEFFLDGINIKDFKCNNRFFRSLIHHPVTCRSKQYWRNIFGNLNWPLVWTYNNKFCITNKVTQVYFKIIHLIYPTNQFLQKFKKDLSDSCVFCNINTETIVHLFFDCIYTRFFWIDIENLFELFCGEKIKIQKKDVFFFHEENYFLKGHIFFLNLIILYGKFYIHKCKWTRTKPNITQFKVQMKSYFETLKGLSNPKATDRKSVV